ncbi:MAG: sugar kinase [Candidatus Cloacimonetes bacterium]|nr:sugar kinase [Candidatus Cloacimonadota bacterium]
MSLIVIGSIALDSVQSSYGETKDALGGSAIFASLSASKFTKVHLIGVVGSDFPQDYLSMLKKKNISLDGLRIEAGKTFKWSGLYNDTNQAETIDTQLNVFKTFQPEIPDSCNDAQGIFLGNIDPDLQLSVIKKFPKDIFVSSDTMNYWIKSKIEKVWQVIKYTNLLFINDTELKMLTGIQNIFLATKKVLSSGPDFVVVKRGEYGSFIMGSDLLYFTPVFPVEEVKDPTGAGDSFAGGFLGFLNDYSCLNSEKLKEAMLIGTITASFNIESFSTKELESISRQDIEIRKKRLEYFCR